MKKFFRSLVALLLLSVLNSLLSTSFAQGTAFTYQGRLNDGATPASGIYDLRFAIYDAASAGTQQGNLLTNSPTAVTNGLFTVTLDFGNQFPGPDRWLEIAVRTNGGAGFATLVPRQKFSPTPYAVTAGNVTGVIASGNLPANPNVSGTVTASAFSGNGSGLTALSAAAIASGTLADARLSTNVALLNTNALFAGSVGGSNLIAGTLVAVSGAGSSIAGGRANTNAAAFSFIGAGTTNRIESAADRSGIVAGRANVIAAGAQLAVIGGGSGNQIGTNAAVAAIVGGGGNSIGDAAGYGFIGGGDNNTVGTNSDRAVIGGGNANAIGEVTSFATIGGGLGNQILAGSRGSFVGGGENAIVSANSTNSVVAGGKGNIINGSFATVPGGQNNQAGADYTFAAGRRANAVHPGTFVWADSQNTTFSSTTSNTFLIRATNGVGINKAAPVSALDVNGTVTALAFAGSGAALTNLTPTNFSGRIPESLLSSNVALLNAAQSFTSNNTFFGGGNMFRSATNEGGDLQIGNRVAGADSKLIHFGDRNASTGLGYVYVGERGQDDTLELKGTRVFINSANVGIGVTNPSVMLEVAGTVTAANFNGDGSGLVNLPIPPAWQPTGNAVTAGQFLGSTNGQALEFRAANLRTLRIEPTTNGTPNIIGGAPINFVQPGVVGAVISGGGTTNSAGNTFSNVVASHFGAVGGGLGNTIGTNSASSFIGGGQQNRIANSSQRSTIGGGESNDILDGSGGSTVAGGFNNNVYQNSDYAVIAGGNLNSIEELSSYSTIGGGSQNIISDHSNYGLIAGGYWNLMYTNCNYSIIGGGYLHRMYDNCSYSLIGGGYQNIMGAGSSYAVIAGGNNNSMGTNSDFSFIGGGSFNYVGAPNATVPGGNYNTAKGNYSFAAGRNANALHQGTFVWADSSSADFDSSGNDQFLIRANGGVGIGVTNPAYALDVGNRMRMRGVALGISPGTWLYDNTTAADRAFMGLAGPGYIGFWGNNGAGWGLVMNTTNGNIGIGTTTPTYRLDVVGNARIGGEITVGVITITGGADVAEPFAISSAEVEKGSVMVIDEANPGQLRLANQAYDTRVAGVVSGANGVNPGLTLKQKGRVEGSEPVALTGRVYVRADATKNPIRPGDLLTTSDLPGHAMKAVDHLRAQGAVLGKAMTALENGTGFVLVLITLQ